MRRRRLKDKRFPIVVEIRRPLINATGVSDKGIDHGFLWREITKLAKPLRRPRPTSHCINHQVGFDRLFAETGHASLTGCDAGDGAKAGAYSEARDIAVVQNSNLWVSRQPAPEDPVDQRTTERKHINAGPESDSPPSWSEPLQVGSRIKYVSTESNHLFMQTREKPFEYALPALKQSVNVLSLRQAGSEGWQI